MQLIQFDTAGIQPYIFRSNRLRENLGASYLVAQATDAWVREEAGKLDGNLILPEDPGRGLETDGSARFEIIYTAGGNALLLARSEADAVELTRRVSERVLEEAPGLRFVAAHQPYEWNTSLPAAMSKLAVAMAKQKRGGGHTQSLLGLSVTRACVGTGLPASTTRKVKDEFIVSAEVAAKLDHVSSAKEALEGAFTLNQVGEYDLFYPTELDDLGRSRGESSLIAVVHADGDAMGQIFRELGGEYDGSGAARAYIGELRKLSRKVDNAARDALIDTLAAVAGRIEEEEGKLVIRPEPSASRVIPDLELAPVAQNDPSQGFYLPVRPIIFGGDDVTLVCDARIALEVARIFIEAFTERMEKFKTKEPVTASAGVAIVKSHYPFARAYELAEALTTSAKDFRREKGLAVPCLDWHFVSGTIYDGLSAMRTREYDGNRLMLRPVAVAEDLGPNLTHRRWSVVDAGTRGFQHEDWIERRNKLKRLRDAMREGEDAVKQLISAIKASEPARRGDGVDLPLLPDLDHAQSGGHIDQEKQCVYFDAIELSDIFIPLQPNKSH